MDKFIFYSGMILLILRPILLLILGAIFIHEMPSNEEEIERGISATSNYLSEKYNNFVDKYATVDSGNQTF